MVTNQTLFIVRILDLRERTKEEFEYSDLLSALRVAKETEINGSPAINDERFTSVLLQLLTDGFVYAGKLDKDYPEGDYMIMLLSNERPVYSHLTILPSIPRVPYRIPAPVAESIPVEPYTIMKLLPMPKSPVAEEWFSDPERSSD